jgi:phenylalanyl-tRNA synthetase alpha chain
MDHLKELIELAKKDFEECKTLTELDNSKSKYIGKAGPLTEAMRGLSKLSNEDKPKAGAFINQVKQSIETLLNNRKEAIQKVEMLSH